MKGQIVDYIRKCCKQEKYDKCCAEEIATEIKVSRNQVVQILNDLVQEGILIKIAQKPFLFLEKDYFEKQYALTIDRSTYPTQQAFLNDIKHTEKDFELLIGHQESLKNLVEKMKATLSYPPVGLPILLYGPTGTGKSFLAKLAYQYCINHKIINQDKRFVQVNCSEYANNPELLTANLFGYKKGAFTGADQDTFGLLHHASGGVLLLDEVHCLKAECQEKLFLYMDQGIYHMVGDNDKWQTSTCRLIFATTEIPEDVLLKTLLRRIPVLLTVPSLNERSTNERLELIYHLYREEEKRIQKRIQISSNVHHVLLHYPFTGNVGELANIVQESCVHALFQATQETINIYTYHLPENVKKYMDASLLLLQKQQLIPLSLLKPKNQNDRTISFYEQILESFHKNELASLGQGIMESYFDRVAYHKHPQAQKEYMIRIVTSVFEMLTKRYGLHISHNEMVSISSYLLDYMRNSYAIVSWEKEHQEDIQELLVYLQNYYCREYAISKEACEHFKYNVHDAIGTMMIGVFTIYIHKHFKHAMGKEYIAIILAHGYSTASSIAESVNKLLDHYVFDAIDMPLHIHSQDIIQRIHDFLKHLNHIKHIYLLVDMGSLEDIYKGLGIHNTDIVLINNVSTKLALHIGSQILQHMPMKQIVEEIQESNPYTIHLQLQNKKEPVILCSCVSGLGAAQKLQRIISESLPKQKEIKVLCYDFDTLIERSKDDRFLEEYDLICVVGTLRPNDSRVRFIAIEDLIINTGYEKLSVYFKEYMNEEELKIFERNILKNFSLSNVMANLTILNPDKLLEHVSKAIDKLQVILDKQFKNHTCFGLYVHICCLIERLLTQQTVSHYDEYDFEYTQEAFISAVKEAMKEVEDYYRVTISIVEIGYIYDYVHNDSVSIVEDF